MLQCVYKQPCPLDQFIDSHKTKRAKLPFDVEYILCHHTLIPKISIIVDLYSQLDPPLLSPHTIKTDSRRTSKFIMDVMQQDDDSTSYYKYTLKNCYITKRNPSEYRRYISEKLKQLEKYQFFKSVCNENNLPPIYNSQACNMEKVYLGFTAYAWNNDLSSCVQLGETIYSDAIYDISIYNIVIPCVAPTSGGTGHILHWDICHREFLNTEVKLLLTDQEQSWQVEITGVKKIGGIHFVAPPYTGNWNSKDNNRLIEIEIFSELEFLARNYRFVYK